MKTKKKNSSGKGCLAVIIMMVILSVIFYNMLSDENTSNFEQVGYFKKDLTRVYTYNIINTQGINRNKISDSLLNDFKALAIKDMHSKGHQTQSFLYLNDAPDITLITDLVSVIDICYNKKPIAVFIQSYDGKNYFELNPK